MALFNLLIPGYPFPVGVHLFSALCSSLASVFVCLAVMTMLQPGYRFLAGPGSGGMRPPYLPLVAGIAGGLTAGFSYTIWFQAITAEAYALNGLFAAVLLYLFISSGQEGILNQKVTRRQGWYLFALAAGHGLSCANHPVTVIFVVPFLYYAWRLRLNRHPQLFTSLVLVWGLTGLLPYTYLLYAARAYADTIYNNVLTVSDFIHHITGAQWTAHETSYGWSFDRLWTFPVQLWQEFYALGLVCLGLGFYVLGRLQRQLFIFCSIFCSLAWFVPMAYLQGGEYDMWFIPLYLCLYIIVGYGFAQLLTLIK
ncbi:protein O-mannosyl-transferase family, partial [candidate division CSSED10-310 bacterium]